jgi:hypothetical protein
MDKVSSKYGLHRALIEPYSSLSKAFLGHKYILA